jgi:hypothetical protein
VCYAYFKQYLIRKFYNCNKNCISTNKKGIIRLNCNLYSSLKYLKGSYKIGQCHPLATTISTNMREIIRIPIRLKIATGTYILQANRASFNRSQLNPICFLCGNGEETLNHFLLTCNCLDGIRAPLVKDIINTCSALFAKNKLDGNINFS